MYCTLQELSQAFVRTFTFKFSYKVRNWDVNTGFKIIIT